MHDSVSDPKRTDAGISFVQIGVSDPERSEWFYGELLGLRRLDDDTASSGRRIRRFGGAAAHVRLVEVADPGRSAWEPDDLQCGLRHVGLKVADIDGWMARLSDAGVRIAAGPFDAFGAVRIAFFFDPDGAYLELVQGYVQHNRLLSAELARQEIDGDRDWDGSPRFDHVAISVPDLDQARQDYRDRLGFGEIGQLVRPEEERGFLITNLRAAPGTLEVFSFDVPTHEPEWVDAPERLGLDAIGVRGLPAERLGAGGVRLLPG